MASEDSGRPGRRPARARAGAGAGEQAELSRAERMAARSERVRREYEAKFAWAGRCCLGPEDGRVGRRSGPRRSPVSRRHRRLLGIRERYGDTYFVVPDAAPDISVPPLGRPDMARRPGRRKRSCAHPRLLGPDGICAGLRSKKKSRLSGGKESSQNEGTNRIPRRRKETV